MIWYDLLKSVKWMFDDSWGWWQFGHLAGSLWDAFGHVWKMVAFIWQLDQIETKSSRDSAAKTLAGGRVTYVISPINWLGESVGVGCSLAQQMAQAGARTPLPSCHRLCRWLPSVPRVHSTCRRIDGGMAWHGMVLPHPSESITSRRHVTRNLAPSLRHAIVPSTMVDLRLATMVNDVNLFINYTWIMFEKTLMILVYAYTQQFDCNIRYQVVHVENNPYPFKSFQVACCKTHLFILTDLSGRAMSG